MRCGGVLLPISCLNSASSESLFWAVGSLLCFGLILPVHPINGVGFEITADGLAKRGKKSLFSKLGEQAKALEFVFNGIFHLSNTEPDSCLGQGVIQFIESVGRGDIDAGDRLRPHDEPVHRSW